LFVCQGEDFDENPTDWSAEGLQSVEEEIRCSFGKIQDDFETSCSGIQSR